MFKLGLLLTTWVPEIIHTVGLKLNSTASICATHKSYGNNHSLKFHFDSRVWYYKSCENVSAVRTWLCGGETTVSTTKNCDESEYRCMDGTCILNYYKCDGDVDCLDGDDETYCATACTLGYNCLMDCSSSQCICHIPYVKFLGRCMILSFVLFIRSTDKRSIDSLHHPTFRISSDHRTCWQQGWASCADGSTFCYPMELRCTFQRDIYGDPMYCPNTEHLRYCYTHECPTMFKCRESFCVPSYMVCDQVGDCPSMEDEKECANITCPGMLKCKRSSTCVHPRHVCDGVPDCKHSLDDELLCNVSKCPLGCQCSGQATVCSGSTFFNLSSFSKLSAVLVFDNVTFPVVNLLAFHNVVYLALIQCDLLDVNFVIQPFDNLQKLQYLQISYDELHVLRSHSFRYLSSLTQLILSGNVLTDIKSFAFQGLSLVSDLNLSWLQIQRLHDCTFCYLTYVVDIDLSYNNLRRLTSGMFLGIPNLEQLNIEGNQFKHISTDLFRTMPMLSCLHTDADAVCCLFNHKDRCLMLQNSTLYYNCKQLTENSFIQFTASFIVVIILCLTIVIVSYYSVGRSLTLQFLLIQNLTGCNFLYIIYVSVILVSNFVYSKQFIFLREEWQNGSTCNILGTVFMTSLLNSEYGSCLISFNVLLATKFAMKVLRIKKMPFVIAIVLGWALSALGGIVNYLYNDVPSTTLCIPTHKAFTISYVVVFCIVILITLTNHCIIIQFVYNSTTRIRRTRRVSIKIMTIKFASTFVMSVVTLISIISQTLTQPQSRELSAYLVLITLPCNFICNFVLHTMLRIVQTKKKTAQ